MEETGVNKTGTENGGVVSLVRKLVIHRMVRGLGYQKNVVN